jgi:hypothetical protein
MRQYEKAFQTISTGHFGRARRKALPQFLVRM